MADHMKFSFRIEINCYFNAALGVHKEAPKNILVKNPLLLIVRVKHAVLFDG